MCVCVGLCENCKYLFKDFSNGLVSEFSYVYLKNQGTRILLLCIYRKQEIACKIFYRELEELLDAVSNTTEALLVVGDFNIWIDVESSRDAKKLSTLLSAYGLSQLIKEPTHKEGHTPRVNILAGTPYLFPLRARQVSYFFPK